MMRNYFGIRAIVRGVGVVGFIKSRRTDWVQMSREGIKTGEERESWIEKLEK